MIHFIWMLQGIKQALCLRSCNQSFELPKMFIKHLVYPGKTRNEKTSSIFYTSSFPAACRRLKGGSILTLDHMMSPSKIKILDMKPNFNTGTGIIKGWRHQVNQGHMVCVYGDLAIVKVEVQFVNGVVNGVCFFLNGAQNFHYVFCLSKTDRHILLIHWSILTAFF